MRVAASGENSVRASSRSTSFTQLLRWRYSCSSSTDASWWPGSICRTRSYTSAADPPSPILSAHRDAACIRTSTRSFGLASARARRSRMSTASSQRASCMNRRLQRRQRAEVGLVELQHLAPGVDRVLRAHQRVALELAQLREQLLQLVALDAAATELADLDQAAQRLRQLLPRARAPVVRGDAPAGRRRPAGRSPGPSASSRASCARATASRPRCGPRRL